MKIESNQSELKMNNDYYLLTEEFWNFLYGVYGGYPIVVTNVNGGPPKF
jgi:hypothetical protein